ncbi:hypothetical protein Hanom_Chr06g00513531 [Helianthus anomalus]
MVFMVLMLGSVRLMFCDCSLAFLLTLSGCCKPSDVCSFTYVTPTTRTKTYKTSTSSAWSRPLHIIVCQ